MSKKYILEINQPICTLVIVGKDKNNISEIRRTIYILDSGMVWRMQLMIIKG